MCTYNLLAEYININTDLLFSLEIKPRVILLFLGCVRDSRDNSFHSLMTCFGYYASFKQAITH